MQTVDFEKDSLEFDDVVLIPRISNVSSREEVDISVSLSDFFTLRFPLIASPMVGVTSGSFAHKLSSFGGLAILHRFYQSLDDLDKDIRENLLPLDVYGLSIGLNGEYKNLLHKYCPSLILLDVANGYIKDVGRMVENIASYISKEKLSTLVMAGNVATPEGLIALRDCGANLVRVGIGSGGNCSTSNVTGIKVPSITMLHEMSDIQNVKVVMDGGIKNSGDFVKALVAGADLGLAGTLFAECYEAPNEGKIYGMASRSHMEKMGYKIRSVEGFDKDIEKKHSLKDFVSEFGYGIKSAGTYLNAKNLNEIRANGKFIKVGNGSLKKL